jgi:zinc transport system substrate-binding protein
MPSYQPWGAFVRSATGQGFFPRIRNNTGMNLRKTIRFRPAATARNAIWFVDAAGKKRDTPMDRKIIQALFIILIIISYISGCTDSGTGGQAGSHKIRVVTTLFPLYDMARNIGADKAEVSLLLPPGVEAHSFEPKPSDIVKINEADILVFTGRFMEPWAADIIKSLTNKKLIVVDASRGTNMLPGVFHDVDLPADSLDPHIWLDFENASIMVKNIGQALETKDPANRVFFKKNEDRYNTALTALDTAYRTGLTRCTGREIVYGGHYAFGYLAHRYGLKYLAAQGVSPDAEPTARDLTMLVDQIRKDHIQYVFYEELTSPRIAETIAAETHAKLLLLNAGHNVTRDQLERGITLFDILTNDLAALKVGLGCR